MIKTLSVLYTLINATSTSNNNNLHFGYCRLCDCVKISTKISEINYKCLSCNSLHPYNFITLHDMRQINNHKIKYIFKNKLISKKKLKAYKQDLEDLTIYIERYCRKGKSL